MDLVNSVIIFLSQTTLLTMVSLLTWIPDTDCHSCAVSDMFLSSNTRICCAVALPPLGNSDHIVVLVSLDFPSILTQDSPFHRIAYEYSCADWGSLCDHLRDISVHVRISLNLLLLLLVLNFVSPSRMELM